MDKFSLEVPDLILHNGTVHTVNATDETVQAIAVRGQRILAVGSSADLLALAGPSTRRIDLAGRTVVPGFVDAHPHMDTVGLRLIKPDFGLPTSIDDILEVVRQEVARRKPGEWIICNPIVSEPEVFKYPQALKEGRWPNRHDLDRVSPDNPVYIEPPQLVAPGYAIANTAALRSSGVRADSPVADGIEILVDDKGEPTGVLRDVNFPKRLPVLDGAFVAKASLFPTMPELTDADTRRAVAAGMKAFNACGITMIYEGHGIPAGPQRAYLDLRQKNELSIRTYFVVSYPIPLYKDLAKGKVLIEQTSRYAAGPGFGDDLLKFGGLGFSFDGAAAIGACMMRFPYVGATGKEWLGVQLPTDEAFREIARECAAANLRVQVQCSGGAAIDKVLSIYDEIDRDMPIEGKRWTIQHCQFPSGHNMDMCRRMGVLPTTTTNFLWLYGSIYEKAFGEEVARDAIPFRRWMDAGVPVAQCTDGRAFEPVFALWQMLARQDAHSGKRFTSEAQRLTRQQALRAYTLNGARTAFWENDCGSIEPGKYADLAILSADILSIPEDDIPKTQVVATVLGGRPVHDTGLFGG